MLSKLVENLRVEITKIVSTQLAHSAQLVSSEIGFVTGRHPDVPEIDFPSKFDAFTFESILTRTEAIAAIMKVRAECNEVSAKSLFHIPILKQMKVEEFVQTQSQMTSTVSLFLRDQWKSSLTNEIRAALREVGRGWFNLYETNWEVYQISKLKKFMEMVKFCMQASYVFCFEKVDFL